MMKRTKDNQRQAKLIWPNGDTFEGEVYKNSYKIIGPCPYNATIKYHDGQVWEYRNQYGFINAFEDFRIGEDGFPVSPSEMRESFENTIREREEKRMREEEERRRKEEEQLRKEEERKAEAQRAKIAYKEEMICKYGKKYGEAISEKEPMRGMTIEMVKEIHSGDTGHAYRRTSQGKDIVVLTYGGGSDSLLGFAIKKARYEYTFVNGRLESYSADSGEIRQIW